MSIEPILRISRDGDLPLSRNQELRLTYQLSPKSAIGNFGGFCLLLEGKLDPALLEDSINLVVQRHELLRTSFLPVARCGPLLVKGWNRVSQLLNDPGKTEPKISFRIQARAEARLTLKVSDIRHLSPDQQQEDTRALTKLMIWEPYDCDSPPLLRCALIRLSEETYRLIVGASHLVFDGMSRLIFERELVACYRSLMGLELSLPELPVQYVDFAHWQNERLRGGLLEKSASYWDRIRLEFPPLSVTDLPFAKTAAEIHLTAGSVQSIAIDAVLGARLQTFSRRAGSLFAIAVTTVGILLHLATGRNRIPLQAAFANRSHQDVQNLIGDFATTHLLGIEITPDQSMQDLVQYVQGVVLEAIEHQEVVPRFPVMRPSNKGGRPGGPSNGPKARAIFCEVIRESGVQNLPGLSIRSDSAPGQRDIILLPLKFTFLQSSEGQLTGMSVTYQAERFDSTEIQRMLGATISILTQLSSTPSAKVSSFNALLHS